MESQEKVQPCLECGSTMKWERREEVLTYLGHEKKIITEGYWCSQCGEGILEGPALLGREKAFLELRAEADGVLGPQEIARIRQRLGLSQREASEVLGGGPRSFQKYESGKQAASAPMSNLLRLLDVDPSRLKELQNRARTLPEVTQKPHHDLPFTMELPSEALKHLEELANKRGISISGVARELLLPAIEEELEPGRKGAELLASALEDPQVRAAIQTSIEQQRSQKTSKESPGEARV